MVHPDLQGKDFMALQYGDPFFLTFEGETIRYEKAEESFAVFINEAAYYEKGFALCLCKKKSVKIPTKP
jgi:aspartoacylase